MIYEEFNRYIYIITIINCKEPDVDESPLTKPSIKAETVVEAYKYTLGDIIIKWTAFKHSAKAQVGGAFKSSEVEGFTESQDQVLQFLSYLKIPVNSTSTNDTVRDYKIVNSFFNTMVNTEFITGKIISLNNNGSGLLAINMNNREVEKIQVGDGSGNQGNLYKNFNRCIELGSSIFS